LDQLNDFIGTPEGRKRVKAGLAEMAQYRPMILSAIQAYGLPEDLIAIPLLESGFKNLPPHPPQKGAGIWEFITETAQRYHLKVSDENDERLNPAKETEAAMQYLRDLNQQFQDWRLAIGDQRV
jgi:soluble lytic murein transglycosylase-like protein